MLAFVKLLFLPDISDQSQVIVNCQMHLERHTIMSITGSVFLFVLKIIWKSKKVTFHRISEEKYFADTEAEAKCKDEDKKTQCSFWILFQFVCQWENKTLMPCFMITRLKLTIAATLQVEKRDLLGSVYLYDNLDLNKTKL